VERIRAGIAGYVKDILGDTDDSGTEHIENNSFIIPLNNSGDFNFTKSTKKFISSFFY
jgi:hypothetical protein